jgi:hypothetical protein
MSAASSLHTTASDFARFMCAAMCPSSHDPDFLSPEMTAEMFTPQVQVFDSSSGIIDQSRKGQEHPDKTNPLVSWGLGWGIQHTSNGDSIWHWGDNGDYRAFVEGYPEAGHGIVVMTNAKKGQKVIDTILNDDHCRRTPRPGLAAESILTINGGKNA